MGAANLCTSVRCWRWAIAFARVDLQLPCFPEIRITFIDPLKTHGAGKPALMNNG